MMHHAPCAQLSDGPAPFVVLVIRWTSGLAFILAEGAIELSATLSGGALFAS